MFKTFFKKKIKFILPDILYSFFINIDIISLQKTKPEYFIDDYEISSVYGCFPFSIWSLEPNKKYISEQNLKKYIGFYKKSGISINYLFDVENITCEELNDTFSNLLLKLAHDRKNSVIVKSDLLIKYIKKNYPKYKIIKYDSQFISDDFLNHLKIWNKRNINVVLNSLCPLNCEYRDFHNKYSEAEKKNFSACEKIFPCPLQASTNFYSAQKNSNFVDKSKLADLIKKGYRNFVISDNKILANTMVKYSSFDIIESYVYYLIKPQYATIVKNILINNYLKREKKYGTKNEKE